MVNKFTDQPCPRCGAPERVINPAWLVDRRKKAGVTLREIARRLDFSAPYICDVERGRRAALPHIVKVYEELS